MKKLTVILLAVLALAAVCFLSSCSEGVADENGLVYAENAELGGYSVVGYRGEKTDVVIPSVYGEGKVVAIAESAFSGNEKITSVKIPDSVKSVGAVAFKNCVALTSVTFEGNQTIDAIPTGLFTGCEKLASIVIPDSVKTVGYKAFENCKGLVTVTLSASIELIDNYAFSGCASLVTVTLNSDAFTIRANAFRDCPKLSSLSTPADGPADAEYNYTRETGLLTDKDGKTLVRFLRDAETFEIPASIEAIADGAFFGQFGLKSISVAEGSANFSSEDGVLYNKDGTRLIAFPAGKETADKTYAVRDGVTEIGVRAFSGTQNLTSVTLPASVTVIGKSAFADCNKLVSVVTGTGTVSVGSGAFYGCDMLESYKVPTADIECKLVSRVLFTADDKAIVSYPSELEATSYAIPDAVEEIVPGAFSRNKFLTALTVGENKAFKAADGILYTADGTTAVVCPAGKSGTVKLQKEVVKLADGALSGCAKVDTLIILADAFSLGTDTFKGCDALASVKFAGSQATFTDAVKIAGETDKGILNRAAVSYGYAE